MYWDLSVENDLMEYINHIDDWDKHIADKFFREKLYDKFYQLSENILKTYNNRYGFNRIDEEFENLIHDCVSEAYIKLNYFDQTRNTRAFSYFGTVIKNYLIRRVMKQTSIESYKINLEDFEEIEFEKNKHFIEDDNANAIIAEEEDEKILNEKLWGLKEVLKENNFTDVEKNVIETFLLLYKNSKHLDFYNKKYIYVLMNEINNIDKKHFYPALKKFMEKHDKFWEEKLWN